MISLKLNMAAERTPDLSQIDVAESSFIECRITNSEVAIWPDEVFGFSRPETKIFPLYDSKNSRVGFDIRVKVVAIGEEGKPLPVEGFFRVHIGFYVSNLADFLEDNEHLQEKTPNSLLTTSLIGVAYSTARGMILSKVADTTLEKFGLPLRSARQLVRESQVKIDEVITRRANLAESKSAQTLPAAEEQE
jgi:hypothetical protein